MVERRLLVLASYPRSAAATRFRACQYFPALAARGISAELWPFLDEASAARLYVPGGRARKALGLVLAGARRLTQLVQARRFDAVFVQREAALVGPPLIEQLLARRFGIPLVMDIDDAVWVHDATGSAHPLASRLLRFPGKADALLAMATEVIAASRYLAEHAARLGARTTVLHTVVSREAWRPAEGRLEGGFATRDGPPTIGWVGTHSTATHLRLVVPALEALAREGHRFRLRVVGSAAPLDVAGVPVERAPWREATEIEDFRRIDVGIAPVLDTGFSRGKGGFKQIQYMTVGVPFVSSRVGAATEFLEHERNALLADTPRDWEDSLRRLLVDRDLRARLARSGRALACEALCAEAQSDAFVDVIERAMNATARPRRRADQRARFLA